MPRILLKTRVKGDPASIMARFDKSLFESLSPPGAGVELIRFDGSKTGDQVHVRMSLLLGLIKQDWFAEITAHGEDENSSWFVDEGKKLPFFLKKWKHRHIAEAVDEKSSYIIDDIHFKSPFFLLDPFLYPVMWLQFAYRKPIYRKIFGKG
ncbi:MAG: hypothetical protein AB8F95_18320 [Bacteroidia bacterium]